MNSNIISFNPSARVDINNAIICFHHIMKCGGSTLRNALKIYVEENFSEKHIYPNMTTIHDWIHIKSKFGRNNLSGPVLIMGHNIWGIHEFFVNRPVYYITMLRDPLERAISDCVYSKARLYNTEDQRVRLQAINNHLIQSIVGWDFGGNSEFALETALKKLKENYFLVGVMERYNDFLAMIDHFFNIHIQEYTLINKANREESIYERLGKDVLSKFQEANEKDFRIYEWSAQEFNKKFKSIIKKDKDKYIKKISINISDKSIVAQNDFFYNLIKIGEHKKVIEELESENLSIPIEDHIRRIILYSSYYKIGHFNRAQEYFLEEWKVGEWQSYFNKDVFNTFSIEERISLLDDVVTKLDFINSTIPDSVVNVRKQMIYLRIAMLYYEIGQVNKATELFIMVFNINPLSVGIIKELFWFLISRQKRFVLVFNTPKQLDARNFYLHFYKNGLPNKELTYPPLGFVSLSKEQGKNLLSQKSGQDPQLICLPDHVNAENYLIESRSEKDGLLGLMSIIRAFELPPSWSVLVMNSGPETLLLSLLEILENIGFDNGYDIAIQKSRSKSLKKFYPKNIYYLHDGFITLTEFHKDILLTLKKKKYDSIIFLSNTENLIGYNNLMQVINHINPTHVLSFSIKNERLLQDKRYFYKIK